MYVANTSKKFLTSLISCALGITAIFCGAFLNVQTTYAANTPIVMKSCTTPKGAIQTLAQSPFNSTKGMCLGQGPQTSQNYYQFAVVLKDPIAKLKVTAKAGKLNTNSAVTISFVKENDLLYVSKPVDDNLGYGASSVPGIGNCDNGITYKITATGNDNKTQDFTGGFCDKVNSNQTLVYVTADQLVGDNSKPLETGTITGNIAVIRDGAPSSDSRAQAAIEKSGVTSIKLVSIPSGSTILTGDSTSNWYSLTKGLLTVGSLAPGQYKLNITYNDQIASVGGTAFPAEWTSSNINMETPTVTVVAGKSIPLLNGILYFNSKTGKVATAPVTKAATTTTTCAIEGIGWIVCPVVRFMGGIVDGSWNILQGFLQTSPSIVKTGDITYRAWQSILNIANIAFVILFLVIIFSQLTSFGIDNYGIKKMLPRLIIAAILVNVSFYICQIAVDLSNILGFSIKSVLDNLVNTSSAPKNLFLGGTQGSGTSLVGGILATVGAGAIAFAALGTLIPVLIAGIVAVVLILFLLIGRQALIILLVVISPLAFVAFLLPNTEKLFKSWQKMFVSMLLLFPIIALVMGTADMASSILNTVFVGESKGSAAWIGQIAAAAVSILPLFVVPGLLKKSLDGVGSIGAKLNGLATKTSGSVGKYASDKSRLGQFAKYKSSERDRTRSLVQSGAYTGKNPFHKVSSKINKAYNEGPLSGSFGARSAASGLAMSNKIEDEQVSNAAALYKSQKGPEWSPANTALDYESAVRSGDTVKTLALQSILRTSGAPGLDALHGSIERLENTGGFVGKEGLRLGVKRDILNSGLKGKDAGLNAWSYSSSNTTLNSLSTNKKTFEGLTDTELSGQTMSVLEKATEIKADDSNFTISADIAKSLLNNQTTSANLGRSGTRTLFDKALNGDSTNNDNTNGGGI